MTNLYKKLNRESDHIRLTAEEKNAMRALLRSAMQSYEGDAAVASPYAPALRSFRSVVGSHRLLTALAALVLVVLAGGSTAAYAARGSLPGQPLYALKTKVLEPVEVALAATPAAKAQVETQIATRRVAEAQALAAQGRLDATTTQELEVNFNEHAAQALALAGEGESATTTLTVALAEAPKTKAARPRRAASTFAISTTSATTTSDSASSTERAHAGEASSTAASTPQEHAQTENEGIHASIDEQRSILDQIIEVQIGGHTTTTTSHKKRGN